MKLFIVAAVLIASVFAEPESDAKAEPWLTYGTGYPVYAGSVAAQALAGPSGLLPIYGAGVYGAGVYGAGVYGAGYNGYALGAHYLGKRSADSDAEAKPWLTYAAAAYPYAATYAHAAYPYAGVYGAGVYGAGYNGYALGYNGYNTHFIGKRSAEAEAEPEAWYGAYNGYAGYGYGGRYATYARPASVYYNRLPAVYRSIFGVYGY